MPSDRTKQLNIKKKNQTIGKDPLGIPVIKINFIDGFNIELDTAKKEN